MARLIDADELRERGNRTALLYNDFFNRLIDESPTIEAEPIVHCGKCHFAERYTMHGEPRLFCTNENRFYYGVPDYGFCFCGIKNEVGE